MDQNEPLLDFWGTHELNQIKQTIFFRFYQTRFTLFYPSLSIRQVLGIGIARFN